MPRFELVATTIWFVAALLIFIGFGSRVMDWLSRLVPAAIPDSEEPLAEHVGAALLLGLGAFGLLSTVIGLVGAFYRPVLFILLVAMLGVSARRLWKLALQFVAW